MRRTLAPLCLAIVLQACGRAEPPIAPEAPAPAPFAAAPAQRPTDAWIGRWIGLEGNYLDIAPRGDGYAVTVQELDGLGTYDGEIAGEGIRFTRRGVNERIVAGDGAATGLRYLFDKDNCLIIRAGEGFCR